METYGIGEMDGLKRLVILSDESVFSGVIKCGMAEVTDSLANAVSMDYDVCVICPDGNGKIAGTVANMEAHGDGVRKGRFSNVTYYLVAQDKWPDGGAKLIDEIKPDILHNMSEADILSSLAVRPKRCILSFDNTLHLRGKEDILKQYDSVTTNSKAYAKLLLERADKLAGVLAEVDFHGVTDGILDTVLAPERGVLIPARYSAEDLSGKSLCKERLKQTYGIKGDPAIYLMMCRLVREKNVEAVLDALQTIKDTGGILLVVGKGDPYYERKLRSFTREDGIICVNRWASPLQAAPMTAGADFYIQPSRMESGGLMPMTACHYGAIPIVTQNGGLADNFNENNAIIVYPEPENGAAAAGEPNVKDAIERASALYADKEAFAEKQRVCMRQDFSWNTRKKGYTELYEKE